MFHNSFVGSALASQNMSHTTKPSGLAVTVNSNPVFDPYLTARTAKQAGYSGFLLY